MRINVLTGDKSKASKGKLMGGGQGEWHIFVEESKAGENSKR
jgi:hypothetical protein